MTEIYLHFLCAHYGLSGNAPVLCRWEAKAHVVSMSQEIDALTKQEANMIIEEIKQVVPGQVRQKLHLFTPASVPNLAEFRMVRNP